MTNYQSDIRIVCLFWSIVTPSLSFSVYSPRKLTSAGVTKVRPTHILASQEIVVRFDDSVERCIAYDRCSQVNSSSLNGFCELVEIVEDLS